MPSYLVESPHTPEDCIKTFDYLLAAGYITHFYWACPTGEHTGYVIFDAASKSEALMVVPPFVRSKARAVELTQFTPDQVKAMHTDRH